MKMSMLVFAVALVAASCGGADTTTRNESGEIVESGEIDVFTVQIGDCISWPTNTDAIAAFDGVACDEPHDGEIFELFDITGFDEFPGDEVVGDSANVGCLDAFEPFVGIAYAESEFFFTTFIPTQETWDQVNDREVICILTPGEGQPQLTTSLEGAAS